MAGPGVTSAPATGPAPLEAGELGLFADDDDAVGGGGAGGRGGGERLHGRARADGGGEGGRLDVEEGLALDDRSRLHHRVGGPDHGVAERGERRGFRGRRFGYPRGVDDFDVDE